MIGSDHGSASVLCYNQYIFSWQNIFYGKKKCLLAVIALLNKIT